ncbi:MAG TPA: glycosyltransferase [Bacteroidia bacterium]|nr:glycosyltransferase [Bacteroidia bacterium]
MNDRKKILFVLSRVPYPLDKGDKLRAFNQIKSLSKNNDIYLFATNDGKLNQDAITELKKHCKEICIANISKIQIALNLLIGFFGNKPFQVYYFHHKSAQKMFDTFLHETNPDAIFCQLLRTAEYAKNISRIPKTIDYQDAFAKGMERRLKDASIFMKPIFSAEFQRLRQYEHIIFHYFEHHVIISEQDKNCIIHEENNKINVIPNGVDLEYFKPVSSKKDFDLVFTGNMSYPPNINCATYLVKEVMPLVWKKFPETKILISGTSPVKEVKLLASKNVFVSGWVNDIRASYIRSKIFIAPMQIGTGLQNKLLEAMAMKIPCITSPLANAPLGAKQGEEILVGENKEALAKLVIQLLQDENLMQHLAEKGRKFVELNYSWDIHNQSLEKIILESNIK